MKPKIRKSLVWLPDFFANQKTYWHIVDVKDIDNVSKILLVQLAPHIRKQRQTIFEKLEKRFG